MAKKTATELKKKKTATPKASTSAKKTATAKTSSAKSTASARSRTVPAATKTKTAQTRAAARTYNNEDRKTDRAKNRAGASAVPKAQARYTRSQRTPSTITEYSGSGVTAASSRATAPSRSEWERSQAPGVYNNVGRKNDRAKNRAGASDISKPQSHYTRSQRTPNNISTYYGNMSAASSRATAPSRSEWERSLAPGIYSNAGRKNDRAKNRKK